MRSAAIALLAALVMTFIPLGISSVFAQTAGDQEETNWHDNLEDLTTFWEGKGKIDGQIRFRVESFHDFDFNDSVETDHLDDESVFLSRIRLNIDVKPADFLRLYLQIQDSHQFETDAATDFRKGPSAREDRVDIFQAYADIIPLDDVPLTFRVGRQVLSYGDQRLIGGFAWSNTARSFNAFKVMYNRDEFFVDAFGGNVIIPEDGHANKDAHDDNFFGVYGGWKQFPGGVWEGYVLLRDNNRKGTSREIYTFGTRLAGNLPMNDAIDYSVELVAQTGDRPGGVDQEAYAAHLGAGYTFKEASYTPRLGIAYNFSTGDDDPTDGKVETLDNLFPTNHLHYGYMDRFSWRNIHNVRLSVSAKPTEKLTVKADLHFLWLDDTSDAWYNAGGGIIRPGTPGADSFVGEEIDLTAKYKLNKHVALQAGYSHFFAADFVEDTGSHDDADWAYFQTVFTF